MMIWLKSHLFGQESSTTVRFHRGSENSAKDRFHYGVSLKSQKGNRLSCKASPYI